MSKEKLSYFSPENVPLGSVVSVPLRSRSVPALVVESEDAEAMKSELKTSAFAMKKINKAEPLSLFSSAFVKASVETADYFASAPGAVLFSLIPKTIFDDVRKLKIPAASEIIGGAHEKLVIQANDEERFTNYKSLIREEFARKRSVFFVLPTIEDIRRMKSHLEKGIEQYTVIFHSKLKPKEMLERWNATTLSDHPVLIIATGQFLSLCRNDVKTIIVEKEASRNYKTISRPYIDIRIFAEKFAKEAGARLILGDLLLRTETLNAVRNDEYTELLPMKFRSLSSAKISLIDMRQETDEDNKRFKVFSNELLRTIHDTKENNERLFLFGARKGYASNTVCADCGEIVRCTNCNAPVVLYMRNAKESYFSCSKCGERRDAHERCIHCESWNLTMLGVGVERIEEEIAKLFPAINIFRLDKESVTTEKRAIEMASKFQETPGSIMIGTELALIYLRGMIENSAVVSIDSLFAVPDFRISEKLFHILLQIRNLSDRRFVIQTRNIKEKIFTYAAQGNLMDFYRDEIEARKQFAYPPFSVFIKISFEGARGAVEAEMRKLKEFLEPFPADLFPGFDNPAARHITMHALLKIKSEEWPARALLEKLRALPPSFKIRVDPDTLI